MTSGLLIDVNTNSKLRVLRKQRRNFTNLINADECGDQTSDSDCLKVRLAEVLVKLVQVVHGQEDAQQVDEDPQNVQNVVTKRTLRGKKTRCSKNN